MVHLFSEGCPLVQQKRRGRTWMVLMKNRFTSMDNRINRVDDVDSQFRTRAFDLHRTNKMRRFRLEEEEKINEIFERMIKPSILYRYSLIFNR